MIFCARAPHGPLGNVVQRYMAAKNCVRLSESLMRMRTARPSKKQLRLENLSAHARRKAPWETQSN